MNIDDLKKTLENIKINSKLKSIALQNKKEEEEKKKKKKKRS